MFFYYLLVEVFASLANLENMNQIKETMKDKGMTLEGLSGKTGLSVSYLSRMSSGGRNVSLKNLDIIAAALDVQPAELMSSLWQDVPICGYVGAGAEVFPFDDLADADNADTVSVPTILGENLIALIVRGHSMHPRYYEGEKIIYTRLEEIPVSLYHKECIVMLLDGRLLVKVLQPVTGRNIFTLKSHNAPDIEAVPVDWVGAIKGRF